MIARDTDTFRNLNRTAKELAADCDHPDVFLEMVRLADALAFLAPDARPAAIRELDRYAASQPCIIWKPEDPTQRHVLVQITRESERIVIAVSRAAWACTHVVRQQGAGLGRFEELHHTCGNNGRNSTGHGACINPAHLVRGTEETRHTLSQVRRTLRRVGVKSVATNS